MLAPNKEEFFLMNDQVKVSALEAVALPIPSRTDLLRSAMKFFKERPDQKFRLFHGIEFKGEPYVRALPIAGTILEPIAAALSEAGVATDGTIGGLLDVEALVDADIHLLACDCHDHHAGASEVGGSVAALIFHARLQHER
jgi:hypothetical protein